MFSSVLLPGTGNNVLLQDRSGVDTGEKDFLILTIVKQDHLFTGKGVILRVVLQEHQTNIDQG